MGDESKELEWALVISVPAQQIQRTILVTSNETIGAVMIKLTNRLGKLASCSPYRRRSPYT